MSNEISSQVNLLLTSDSRYVNMSRNEALSQMVRDGVITQAQYDEVINKTLFSTDNVIEPQETTAELMGATFTNIPQTQASQSQQTRQKRFHPMFKDLLLTSEGKVDTKQFTIEGLKQRYSDEKYEILQKEAAPNGSYDIIDKKTGKLIQTVEKNNFGFSQEAYYITTYNSKGEPELSLSIDDGDILFSQEYYSKDESKITHYVNGDMSQIVCIEKIDKDKNISTFFNSDNTIREKLVIDKNIGNILSKTVYANNKPHAEYGLYDNVTKSFIAERLANSLKSGNVDEIKDIVFNQITPETIYETTIGYFNEGKMSLVGAILTSEVLDNKAKQKIIEHLDSMNNNATIIKAKKSIHIASKIISAQKDEDFMSEILKLDSSNIVDVMKNFGVFGSDYGYVNKVSYDSLVRIIDSRDMSDDSKQLLLNHINDKLVEVIQNEPYKEINFDDILADMENNKNDINKLDIDFQRFIDRLESSSPNENNDVANGDIDKEFFQGSTGDCWLLAGIRSVISRPEGFDALNNMISVDGDGNVTVELRGVGKSYTIPADLISKSNYLSTGDADVRAIEIAIDTYLKEQAYLHGEKDRRDDVTDIWGGKATSFYELFFGNAKIKNNIDISDYDFNDKNKVFTFGHFDKFAHITAYNIDTQQEVMLLSHHAYSVSGNDDEYIYFENPYNSGQMLMISREALKNREFQVCYTKLS